MKSPGGASRFAPLVVLTGVFLAAGSLGMPASGVAGGWSVKSSLSGTSRVNDNPSLAIDGSEAELSLGYNASAAATFTSPRGSLGFSTSVANTFVRDLSGGPWSERPREVYQVFFEEGSSDLTFDANATISRTNSTFIFEEEENLFIEGTSNQTRYATTAGVSYSVNELNSLSLSASASRSEVDRPTDGLVGSEQVSASGSWSRGLTKRLSSSTSASVNHFMPQGSAESTQYNLNNSLSWQPTSYLAFSGGAGVRYIDREADIADPSGDLSGFGFPVNFSATLTHDTANLSFNYARSVTPTSRGVRQASTTTAITYSDSYVINDLSSINWAAAYVISDRSPGDTVTGGVITGITPGTTSTRESFSFSPSFSYSLTPDVSLSAGYQFRMRDAGDGWADSNQVYLTLSTDIVPLP